MHQSCLRRSDYEEWGLVSRVLVPAALLHRVLKANLWDGSMHMTCKFEACWQKTTCFSVLASTMSRFHERPLTVEI